MIDKSQLSEIFSMGRGEWSELACYSIISRVLKVSQLCFYWCVKFIRCQVSEYEWGVGTRLTWGSNSVRITNEISFRDCSSWSTCVGFRLSGCWPWVYFTKVFDWVGGDWGRMEKQSSGVSDGICDQSTYEQGHSTLSTGLCKVRDCFFCSQYSADVVT